MTKLRVTILQLFLIVVALNGTSAPAAENYPSRPVRVIVPYSTGGGTDILARLLAAKLSEVWGQQVIVDNRPGAGGNIAVELAARAAPDGYTLFIWNASIAINEILYAKTLTVKPSRDLVAVINLTELPMLWVVNPTVPARSLKEFIQYAKKTTKRMNFPSAGIGSLSHLEAIRFLKFTGIEMTHVPYKDFGLIITDLINNEMQFMLFNIASGMPHFRAGKIRPLATTWSKRLPELPEVQTTTEAGFPGFGSNQWNAMFAPAKIPAPLLNRIHATVEKALEDPQMKETLGKQFLFVADKRSPAEFRQFLGEEAKKWRKVIADNNIIVE